VDRDVDATGWRAGTPAPRAGMPTSLDGRKRALPVSDDPLARQHRSVAFDRLLESVHREHLSPFDLRVLLRVTDREATLGDLAESMGQPPSVLRRASARLVARGLLRRRSRRNRHHRLQVTLATTASGMSALCRVTRALEPAATDRARAPAAPARLTATTSNPSGDASSRTPAAPPAAARDRRMSGMSRESAVEGRAAVRCVVVGYDGSDSARRAVAQGARAAGPRGRVILVTVAAKMRADGIGAEPLVEPRDQPSHLLAAARAIAARARATDVRMVAKEGNPAEELLEIAGAANADLIIVGRFGKNFLGERSSAQWPVASPSSRTATSSSSPDNGPQHRTNVVQRAAIGRMRTASWAAVQRTCVEPPSADALVARSGSSLLLISVATAPLGFEPSLLWLELAAPPGAAAVHDVFSLPSPAAAVPGGRELGALRKAAPGQPEGHGALWSAGSVGASRPDRGRGG
jgi:nucleotide-binding universal stress UspA family protein/DNA-binding MarR family transcriptional regulator